MGQFVNCDHLLVHKYILQIKVWEDMHQNVNNELFCFWMVKLCVVLFFFFKKLSNVFIILQ